MEKRVFLRLEVEKRGANIGVEITYRLFIRVNVTEIVKE